MSASHLAPRRFHLVAGHGSRRVHIGERVLRFFRERPIAANIAKLPELVRKA